MDALRQRSRIVRLVAFAIFSLIIVRLGWLQLARGGFYRDLSEDNYVQGFEVRAPRGLIIDRNGEILADNKVSLSITLSRVRDRDDEAIADLLSEVLAMDRGCVAEKLLETRMRYYGAVALIENANLEQVSRVEERRSELPGVKVETTARRRYVGGLLCTHALGYVGEVSVGELHSMEPLGYGSGDIVGKTGVEQRYELLLRGRDGAEYWVCDAAGRELYPFEGGPSRDIRPGHSLVLTIDAEAQRAAEEALKKHTAGAVVAIEPRTGEVLVMASHPAPDPNAFAEGLSTEEWRELTTSPTHPLLNRAIQAVYPPGSPFKLVTAGAGLETGVISRGTQVTCKGSYKYGIRTFRCWKAEGHGITDVFDGIVESCDVFMYQIGAKLGVATLMNWAERSGLGRRTGVDIAGEGAGNVPTPAWYDRRYGKKKWSRGVVINLSIGQGELLVTPLQAACLACGIANSGVVYTPHLFKRVETYSGRTIGTARSTVAYELPYGDSTMDLLQQAMVGVVEAQNGTGKLARIEGMEVAGKTGTSQNPHGEDHACFIAYAPADDPQIAIAVIAENAGGGGAIAAPMAREIMKAYFRIKDPPRKPPTGPADVEGGGNADDIGESGGGSAIRGDPGVAGGNPAGSAASETRGGSNAGP
jgi:penicillin-binding protein 2